MKKSPDLNQETFIEWNELIYPFMLKKNILPVISVK